MGRNVTVSIPNLVPEEKCRVIPKEVCQTVFLNPSKTKKTELVKYCMNDETATVGGSATSAPEDDGFAIDPRTNLLRQRQQQQQGRRQPPRGFTPIRVNVNDLAQELRFRNF